MSWGLLPGRREWAAMTRPPPSLLPFPMPPQVNQEVDDMYAEFQREKEDLLESIRMLQDQMQLKDMVIEAFIPPEETQKVRGVIGGSRTW